MKTCPGLIICLRKLKKFLSSFFLNFLSHLQKNSRCRAILYCRCWRVFRGEKTLVLSRHCPRNRYPQIGYNVCVSAVVRFRSRVLSHETKRGTKIKLKTNTSRHHCRNILLWAGLFTRHSFSFRCPMYSTKFQPVIILLSLLVMVGFLSVNSL